MQMTPAQFDALAAWIAAEISAAMVRNSAGPHVRPAQEAAVAARNAAREALVQGGRS